ncbi:HTH domain-containing protein (plasmid) [Butyrivibrio proteoclasticus B316]|uniref:HTH domain-containing protein n=1 Tax=Butyrivibrio proteoclasticus (strain ATCC 51982 / DSM 14932 / B316) TaxID=515622 RepID=E0S4B1_BUTPB|nr:helix-turn-helix transcriptional regulator [Butyrivibrio proteoclasticus]ADL36243.1 HTH domain-containing protein [Butyrivibrio proteoclasticus B316]
MKIETGKDIERFRKIYGFTQEELAKEVHYSKSTIGHLESRDEILSDKIKTSILELADKFNGKSIEEVWKLRQEHIKLHNQLEHEPQINTIKGSAAEGDALDQDLLALQYYIQYYIKKYIKNVLRSA